MARLDRELQELVRMRVGGLITDEEFLRQKRLTLDQKYAAQARIKKSAITAGQLREQIDDIVAPLGNPRQTWHSLKPPARRRFARLLFPVGFVAGKSRTAQLGLLFKLLGEMTISNSSGVHHTITESNLIIAEIQAFWRVLHDMEEPIPTPKWQFRHSHRTRPKMSRAGTRRDTQYACYLVPVDDQIPIVGDFAHHPVVKYWSNFNSPGLTPAPLQS